MTSIVQCGKCMQCLKRRQNGWAFRLKQQQKVATSAIFLTLTYEEPETTFNGHHTLNKRHYQLFIKKLRKQTSAPLKYYMCGEYGTQTHRPHYHAILYNLPHSWIQRPERIQNVWGWGNIDIGDASIQSIQYVVGYIQIGKWQPIRDDDDREPQFSLMSKKMGLNYLTPQMVKFHKNRLESYVTMPGGYKTPLPRYFRDKIFTKEERMTINLASEEAREVNFQKLFDNSYLNETQWKNQKIKQHEKELKLARKGI